MIPSFWPVIAETRPAHPTSGRGGFARGLVFGAVLAAVIVLIFTPCTGEEVREFIGEVGRLLTERVSGALTGESSAIIFAAGETTRPA